ncbi:nitrilase-related carbon-nitrogen hydrolase [Pedosphaera parvula]|uniref:Apolipoprotein N-acyltransferase-like protein n=1 Tax=Pedosphaera parvula (strain Ellin514) TaxID=320771 RepID=B9XP72_PEDPL|nr:nitrilase-related carbon-nitrogen hydrolase [Pedosphaera parvula]EEF58323.1 Apolipoprotein N-acyltransferase-like protein [Pedosphaera parvula Ellin514]
MTHPASQPNTAPPTIPQTLALAVLAVVSFQLAYSFAACTALMALFAYSLFELSRSHSSRFTFYLGLGVGLAAYAPQLSFFWNIFGPAAIALWLVLSFWLATFLLLSRMARVHFGTIPATLLIPFLWTGLEYFRSELYYLKFSWMNIGYAFSSNVPMAFLHFTGIYGIGFLLMAAIALTSLLKGKTLFLTRLAMFTVFAIALNQPRPSQAALDPAKQLSVAGVQLEFPSEKEAVFHLNKLFKSHPDAQLFVLSEYTFNGPVPQIIMEWCREHKRHLIIGAKDPVSADDFNDTAFVINPSGEIIFRQGKSVPIQFFKDGLPAKEQNLWNSPWGKIGICICYDLSYSRVTDGLIRLGAQAIIVPTMDLVDWGRHQHELHARVAPIRAAEYAVPIFRLASSGISQSVCRTGEVLASAPMPGEGAILACTLDLGRPGTLPLDRLIAPISVGIATIAIFGLLFASFRRRNVSA